MHKTDVKNILSNENGILIDVSKESNYRKLRLKAIEENAQKDRINNLEREISELKTLIEQLILKAK